MVKHNTVESRFHAHMDRVLGKSRALKRNEIITEKDKKRFLSYKGDLRTIINKFVKLMNTPDGRELKLAEFELLAKELKSTDNVLSLGSGPALLEGFMLTELVTKGRITCMDLLHQMNTKARNILKNFPELEKSKRLSIITGSGHNIPLKSRSQDKVTFLQAGGSVSDLEKFLSEIKRVLKPNLESKFILTTSPQTTKERLDFARTLQKHGFKVKYARYATQGKMEYVVFVASPQNIIEMHR